MTQGEARILMLFIVKTVLLENPSHSFLWAKCLEVSLSKMKNKTLWIFFSYQFSPRFLKIKPETSARFLLLVYMTNINHYLSEDTTFNFASPMRTCTMKPSKCCWKTVITFALKTHPVVMDSASRNHISFSKLLCDVRIVNVENQR